MASGPRKTYQFGEALQARLCGTVTAPKETLHARSGYESSDPIPWTLLLTTNVAAMPFDFVDFDVKLSEKPQKFYRVRQP